MLLQMTEHTSMKTPVQTSCTTRHVGVNVHIDMHACMQKDNFSCPYCEHYYVCISDMRHCNMLHLGTTELPLSQHVSPFGIAHTHTHVYTDSIYSCTTAQHLERATIFNWYTAAYASMITLTRHTGTKDNLLVFRRNHRQKELRYTATDGLIK